MYYIDRTRYDQVDGTGPVVPSVKEDGTRLQIPLSRCQNRRDQVSSPVVLFTRTPGRTGSGRLLREHSIFSRVLTKAVASY